MISNLKGGGHFISRLFLLIFSSITRIVKGTDISYSKVNIFLVFSPGKDLGYSTTVCESINASLEGLPRPPAPD